MGGTEQKLVEGEGPMCVVERPGLVWRAGEEDVYFFRRMAKGGSTSNSSVAEKRRIGWLPYG